MQIEIPSFDEDIPAPSFGPPNPTGFGAFGSAPSSSHKRDQSNPVADLPFAFPNSSNASRPFGGLHHQAHHVLPSSSSHSYAVASPAGTMSEASTPGLGAGLGGLPWEMRRKQSAASSSAASSGVNGHGSVGSPGGFATPTRNGMVNGMGHRQNGSDVFANGGGRSRSNTGAGSGNGIVHGSDGHAPLEIAVHLIMERFLEECEAKISQLLGRPIPASPDEDVYIPSYLGPTSDPAFDNVFESLANVAKRDPRSVVNCVMRWKSRQGEGIDEGAIRGAVAASGNTANARRVATALSERKGLALIYLLCRALITIVQGATRDALGEDLGKRVEDIVFNSIKNADPYATARNPNKQANMTMFAQLLGALSNIRFTSVSDRFTAEIDLMNRNAAMRDQKDAEARLGYVIKGVQYLKLKVYPLEAFEETADFIASFASIFDASRGNFVKTAMAETLGPLLAQVAESATAEVNHPVWNRAIQIIFTKAHSMSDKPSKARYWPATVPLLCACIGAAPQDFLTAKWTETIDWCFGRMKEKATRPVMMLGVVQLVWSYLHRVKEGASALNKRLEPILKSAFPPDRKNAYPAEVSLDSFASLLHYILHWQLEYGSDFVLRNLLGGSTDSADAGVGLVAQVGPDRIMIAITASIRTLTSLAKGQDPPYPTVDGKGPGVTEGRGLTSREEGSDGDALDPDFLEKPRIKAFVDAAGSRVLQLAAHCDRALAAFTLVDDRLVYPWHDGITQRPEMQESHILRRHGAFAVEYPRDRQPYFDVLESCLQAWPRLLQSAPAESAALDILFRGLLSLDVSVAVESKFCLRRFLAAGKAYTVLQAFTRFIGRPDLTFRLRSNLQKASDVKLEALVKLWVEGMSAWCDQLRKAGAEDQLQQVYQDGTRLVGAIEATSLVLLCSRSPAVRRLALDALRSVASARVLLQDGEPSTPTTPEGKSIANLLDEAEIKFFDTITGDDLAAPEKTRLSRWRKQRRGEALAKLLESDNVVDATLFYCALTSVFSTALAHAPQVITHVRSLLLGSLQRIYPAAADAAGLGRPTTAGTAVLNEDKHLLLAWTSLLISLISVTTSSATKVGTISIGIDSSSNLATRDRVTPGEEMIRSTLPFLTSDQSAYREAAVRALSCIHVSMYPGLLESLAGLAQHLTGERKMAEVSKDRNVRTNPKIVRLFQAIGRLHENTTTFLSHADFISNERIVEILLRFIKETCLFLRARPGADDSSFFAIRKAFCNYCEHVLVLLARTKEIHRFFHSDLLGDMFNLAEEWTLKTPGPDSPANRHPQSRATSVSSTVTRPLAMKTRTSSASSAINGLDLVLPGATLIATLCEGAVDIRHASTMTRRPEAARFRPSVSSNRLLRWLISLFERPDPKVHTLARRAFIGAARTTSDPDGLFEAALSRCWLEPDVLPLSQTLFGIVSNALLSDPTLQVRPAAIITLGIARIAHMDLATRQRALDLLSRRAMSPQFSTWVPDIEAGIQSAFSGQHLVAQYQICAAISQLQAVDACEVIAELAGRIIQLEPHRSRFMARLLPLWLTYIDLGPTVADIVSPRARDVLINLLLISSRLGDTQPDEIRSLWSSLASNLHPLNSAAVITFLLEQTTRRANPAFVRVARIILTCVAEASGAEAVIKDLSASIHPAALLSSGEETPPSPENLMPNQRATDLEIIYPQLPSRTVLSPMQAAILLLGEAMVLRPSALGDRLPNLLHAYIVQADHTNAILRSQMRDALVRYVGMLRRLQATGEAAPDTEDLPENGWHAFWDFEDMGSSRRSRRAPSNMEHLLDEILRISSRLSPDFRQKWGQVAVEWATLCPVRHVACRSLQVLRILAPPLDANALGELLVRLSNTTADPSPEIQVFALEVLQTLTSSARVPEAGVPVAQLFWAGVACLETTNDLEFQEALQLLRIVAEQADESVSAEIAAGRPSTFDGTELLSAIAIKGLRSAPLCHPSWLLIRALLAMPHFAEILDWDHGLPLVYAAILPWGLHNLEAGVPPDHLEDVATGLAELATRTEREGIARVMTSFAKRRFRTNEDFLRQAVGALREYYLPLEAPSLLVLLVGLLFNPLGWLRTRTMAVLRLLLRLVDPTSPEVAELGYDLLTPILSLLQTDVAPQALEVLAEPLPVKAPALGRKALLARDDAVGPRVFGTPDDTGWCVADPQASSFATRRALGDVIDGFSAATAPTRRPSLVEFASEWSADPDHGTETDLQSQSDIAETNESFGDMVSALHNLSDFFGQDAGSPSSRLSSPISPSSARVAAILSRSLSKRRANRPSLRIPAQQQQQANGSSPTRRRTPSTFAATVAASTDTRSGDILEEDEEEEEEEDERASPSSPTETQFEEDDASVLEIEMEDERYRHSSLVHRRKSRPPDAHA